MSSPVPAVAAGRQHPRHGAEETLASGREPFAVVGNAGTVNTGATDDLGALADLTPVDGGVAGRRDRYVDRGPQLSRGFRALKVWMGLKAEGTDKLGRLVQQNVDQAAYLAERVDAVPELERLAPAPLNIVCFRFVGAGGGDLDRVNRALLVRLHEEGIAVPSHTTIGGRFALRVAIVNHRTRREDLDLLVRETVRLGRELARRAP